MTDFPSMKARDLLAVLMREPLNYEIVRQRGSHRRLKASGRAPLTFAFHDRVELGPTVVRKILSRTSALSQTMPSSYCESAVTIRILYHQEPQSWWPESPDIDGWTVAGESYEEVRRLVEDGVSFAFASAAEDRGEDLDESPVADVALEHYVPAPA